MFRRGSEQRHRNDHITCSSTREPQQFGGWIETNNVGDCRAIERKIQPRPHADLKNQPSRRLDRPLAIMVEYPVPHGEVEQPRHNPALVNPIIAAYATIAAQSHQYRARDFLDRGRDRKGFGHTDLVTVYHGMASSDASRGTMSRGQSTFSSSPIGPP